MAVRATIVSTVVTATTRWSAKKGPTRSMVGLVPITWSVAKATTFLRVVPATTISSATRVTIC